VARLPTPGSDSGKWGDILNAYLTVSLNPDGTLKDSAVTETTITNAGGLLASSNLSELTDISTAKTNLSLTKSDVNLTDVDNIQQLPLSYLDTDGTLAANSDTKVASQKATKTYVDTAVGSPAAAVILAPSTSARNTIQPTADVVPLISKGKAGQTANLQEWQDSGGVALSGINSAGTLINQNSATSANALAFRMSGDANNRLAVTNDGTMSWGDGIIAPGLAVGVLRYSPFWGGIEYAQDTANLNLQLSAAGGAVSGNPTLAFYSARGTNAAPTAVQSSDTLAKVYAYGQGATQVKLGGRLTFSAAETWTDSAIGTHWRVYLAPTGGTSLVTSLYANSQGLAVGGALPPSGTVEKLRVNTPTTVDNLANTMLSASAATAKPLVIQGAAAQTANLQEWQTSAGNVLASVSSGGNVIPARVLTDVYQDLNGNAVAVSTGATPNRVIALGNATVATISVTPKAGGDIRLAGATKVNSTGTAGTVEKLRVNTPTTVDDLANTMLSASAATAKPLVIQGAAAQTANLQEWQNSAGTVLQSILASGNSSYGEGINMVLGTTTGTKIGTATTQKLGLWNATPVIQPTTAVTAATFAANTSGIVNDTATFDGYTIGQIVKALRNIGALA